MQRRFRLTSSVDFQRVRRFGRSHVHPLCVLISYPGQLKQSRFGVLAGRSVGKAFQRNRAKRLIREALRECIPSVLSGWDIVVIARKPMAEASYLQTLAALIALLERSNLYECKSPDG